ncbi:MAG: DUF4296 domain-containing protein [Bacteroidales bacterium]|nr:DUF4296 domain-containing protein [Bacteroidales bacterium]
MSSIIIDSKKAEALVQILYSDSNEQEDILNQFNGDILKKYNVSIESYQASIEYYKDNPKEMDKLITSIKLKRAKTNVD